MKTRVLVLTSFAPSLELPRAARVVASLLHRLAARHDVALVCLTHSSEPPVDDALRRLCRIVEEVPLPPRPSLLRRRLTMILKLVGAPPDQAVRIRTPHYGERVRAVADEFEPHVIQVEYVEMAQYFDALHGVHGLRVLVDHDPRFSTAMDYSQSATGLRHFSRRLDAIAWKRFSRRAYARADQIVVFTERDRESVASLAPRTPIDRIPLTVDVPQAPSDPRGAATTPTVLFFGDYLHAANSDAALRLIRTIMPGVRQTHHNADLEIVGRHPTHEMILAAGDRDHIRGVVPSLAPYLDRASVVVVPLRHGGGMRIKVLDTLAAGKALVASPLALEGVDVAEGGQVVVAEHDDEFVKHVTGLLSDDARRVAIATKARQWAETELGWDGIVSAYEELYRRRGRV